MNKNALQAVIKLNGDTQEALARHLGMTSATLSNKINGGSVFNQTEIEGIVLRYHLTAEQIQSIFFASTVN